MIQAGKLRHRLTLEEPAETVSAGEATVPWPTRAEVWGAMEGLTGTNRGGVTAEVEYRIRIRYRSDITPRWRVGLKGTDRKFGLLSVIDPEGRKRELVLLARELI